MPRVVISSSLADRLTGGERSFEVAAENTRAALRALEAWFPGFEEFADKSMAFSIDGEIFQNFWSHPLKPDSEVFLIPRIGGG